MKPAIEIRRDDHGNIDEIFADLCTVHIEQMNVDALFIEIVTNDGTSWRGRIDGMNITIKAEEPC